MKNPADFSAGFPKAEAFLEALLPLCPAMPDFFCENFSLVHVKFWLAARISANLLIDQHSPRSASRGSGPYSEPRTYARRSAFHPEPPAGVLTTEAHRTRSACRFEEASQRRQRRHAACKNLRPILVRCQPCSPICTDCCAPRMSSRSGRKLIVLSLDFAASARTSSFIRQAKSAARKLAFSKS